MRLEFVAASTPKSSNRKGNVHDWTLTVSITVKLNGFTDFHTIKDQADVGPVSGESTLAFYPAHYKLAFAFSALLCPHPQQRLLRVACPIGAKIRGFQVPFSLHELLRFYLSTDGA